MRLLIFFFGPSRWLKLKELGKEFEERRLITLLGHDVTLTFRGESDMTVLDIIRKGFLGQGVWCLFVCETQI